MMRVVHQPSSRRRARRCAPPCAPPCACVRRGMSFIELMVVLGVLALFAVVVIPGVASAHLPLAQPIQEMLEADLRRARTESLARGEAVVMVAAADGTRWWLALATSPESELAGTQRSFGHGALSAFTNTSLRAQHVVDDGIHTDDEQTIVAQFDSLGTRDDAIVELTLSAENANIAQWTLSAGRTRLVAR